MSNSPVRVSRFFEVHRLHRLHLRGTRGHSVGRSLRVLDLSTRAPPEVEAADHRAALLLACASGDTREAGPSSGRVKHSGRGAFRSGVVRILQALWRLPATTREQFHGSRSDLSEVGRPSDACGVPSLGE